MKKTLTIAIVTLGLLVLPAAAQNPSRFGLHLNGWGGFGFGWSNTQWSGLDNTYQDMDTDVGLNANGYLYDPRLLGYDVNVGFNRGSFTLDQGNSIANNLNVNASLSFLPERSFPFSAYFSRTNSDFGGDLVSPFNNTQSIWGFRGAVKNLPIGLIGYNFSSGVTDNELPDGTTIRDRYRTGDVSLSKRVKGWDLRLGDNYNWSSDNTSNFTQSSNTILADASRTFHDRIRVNLNQMLSSFHFSEPGTGLKSEDQVLALNASMTWKHTEKLDSFYTFNLAHNAVNELALLTTINNVSNPLPFNPLVTSTTTEAVAAGANYRPRANLSFGVHGGYSHNSAPELSSLTPEQLQSFTTGTLDVGGSASYRRKLWKLSYAASASLDLQRFTALAGGDFGSGVGFGFDNGVSGGDVRKLRFTAAYRYSRRSNPVFFNAVSTTDNRISGQVETAWFRIARLQATVDYGRTDLQTYNSKLHLGQANYSIMATRSKLSLFFTRISSSSDDRFFGPDSLLATQQSASQAQVVPSPFFNPLVLTELHSTRAGFLWKPKSNLQVEGRYAKYDDLFLLPTQTEYQYSQIEALATYKWGRFTLYGGFGHVISTSFAGGNFDQHVNRLFFRVRFPFHIM